MQGPVSVASEQRAVDRRFAIDQVAAALQKAQPDRALQWRALLEVTLARVERADVVDVLGRVGGFHQRLQQLQRLCVAARFSLGLVAKQLLRGKLRFLQEQLRFGQGIVVLVKAHYKGERLVQRVVAAQAATELGARSDQQGDAGSAALGVNHGLMQHTQACKNAK